MEKGAVVATSTKVAKLQVFDRTSSKVLRFVMVCRLYIRMKIRRAVVEKQIQWVLSYVQGRLVSYASPLIQKLHPHSEDTFKTYKPAFHGSHLSRNTSYSSAATIWVFCLPWWKYFYSTQSSMMELLLSVSQH